MLQATVVEAQPARVLGSSGLPSALPQPRLSPPKDPSRVPPVDTVLTPCG